jgi:hypothetical protein
MPSFHGISDGGGMPGCHGIIGMPPPFKGFPGIQLAPDAAFAASARAATPVPPRGMAPPPRSPTPVWGKARMLPPAKKVKNTIHVSDESDD